MQWVAATGWQGPIVIAAIALINALRRTIFNIVGDPDFGAAQFIATLLSGLVVGFAILLAVVAALSRHPQRGRTQYVAVAGAIVASSAVGVLVKVAWETAFPAYFGSQPELARYFFADWIRYALLGGLIAGAYLYLRADAENAATVHRCEVDSMQMARQAAEARLRLLEAQIEPHFLFNTLATMKRLFRTDSRAGGQVLDNLMRYLSVALPQMRNSESTLGREAELAGAYLHIQQLRMGSRMTFEMCIPPSLSPASLPTFMLLTLIENAIKHGLNPLPEGGALVVTARQVGGKLAVEVRDSGRGFAEVSGNGTGIANIRARLALLYGAHASLAFSHNEPRGVVATLVLPLVNRSGAHAL